MTMTSPMTSEATASCLDISRPIAITRDSEWFEWMCEGWQNSKTIVDLMKREAVERARFAYHAGTTTGTRLRVFTITPKFMPAAARVTNGFPVVTDAFDDHGVGRDRNVTRVLEAWQSEPDTADIPAQIEFQRFRKPFWVIRMTRRIKKVSHAIDSVLDRIMS